MVSPHAVRPRARPALGVDFHRGIHAGRFLRGGSALHCCNTSKVAVYVLPSQLAPFWLSGTDVYKSRGLIWYVELLS